MSKLLPSPHYTAVTSRTRPPEGPDAWKRRLSPSDHRDLEVALLEAALPSQTGAEAERTKTQIAAYKRLNLGGNMNAKHSAAYQKVLDILAEHVVAAGQTLKDLERDKAKFPPIWAETERQRLIRVAQAGDDMARDGINEYAEMALSDARKRRARFDADRPATERAAELVERQALIASGVDSSELVAQAQTMLEADRPQRAAFLLSVADAIGIDTPTAIGIMDFREKIIDAVDASDDTLKDAREIEDEVAKRLVEFDALRLRALAASGIGIAADGRAGSGAPGQSVSANAQAKIAAYIAGGDFSDAPAGGGA